jgi:hypothetical protein
MNLVPEPTDEGSVTSFLRQAHELKPMHADLTSHSPAPGLVRARLDFARARMDLIIQAVCDDVDARASQNIESARGEAQVLRELAKQFEELMETPVIEIANSGGLSLCKVICDLAEVTVGFEHWFGRWVKEHGVLLEDSAKETTRRFIAWVQSQEREVAPIWDRHVAALDRDLIESRDEAAATAADWSIVDADGIA